MWTSFHANKQPQTASSPVTTPYSAEWEPRLHVTSAPLLIQLRLSALLTITDNAAINRSVGKSLCSCFTIPLGKTPKGRLAGPKGLGHELAGATLGVCLSHSVASS